MARKVKTLNLHISGQATTAIIFQATVKVPEDIYKKGRKAFAEWVEENFPTWPQPTGGIEIWDCTVNGIEVEIGNDVEEVIDEEE